MRHLLVVIALVVGACSSSTKTSPTDAGTEDVVDGGGETCLSIDQAVAKAFAAAARGCTSGLCNSGFDWEQARDAGTDGD